MFGTKEKIIEHLKTYLLKSYTHTRLSNSLDKKEDLQRGGKRNGKFKLFFKIKIRIE